MLHDAVFLLGRVIYTDNRYPYYRIIISVTLSILGVDIKNILGLTISRHKINDGKQETIFNWISVHAGSHSCNKSCPKYN